MTKVRKAVIPAAGLGTRFLPFSKAVPKEMLPVVDRPVIQYVIEEAVDAGIEDILVVTSRHKKVLEDHFDRLPELEAALAAKGKTDDVETIKALAEMAQLHYVRQGEALGLGHAIGVARNHVGDEPFVVLLGDDIMHPRAGVVKGMIAAYEEHGCSVVGLMEVPKEDISLYGCAAADPVDERLVEVTGLVEKPPAAEAPSNLAIMGRYLFTPSIFDEIERTEPGVGGEIQITDAMASLLDSERMLGFTFAEGRFDTGKKIDYLRAVVELALERPDLGPAFREILAEVAQREGLTGGA
ncbi:MAG: UTP--glucose-1-phosphate uridylyltransferase GalU [Actinomycetota bacterium]